MNQQTNAFLPAGSYQTAALGQPAFVGQNGQNGPQQVIQQPSPQNSGGLSPTPSEHDLPSYDPFANTPPQQRVYLAQYDTPEQMRPRYNPFATIDQDAQLDDQMDAINHFFSPYRGPINYEDVPLSPLTFRVQVPEPTFRAQNAFQQTYAQNGQSYGGGMGFLPTYHHHTTPLAMPMPIPIATPVPMPVGFQQQKSSSKEMIVSRDSPDTFRERHLRHRHSLESLLYNEYLASEDFQEDERQRRGQMGGDISPDSVAEGVADSYPDPFEGLNERAMRADVGRQFLAPAHPLALVAAFNAEMAVVAAADHDWSLLQKDEADEAMKDLADDDDYCEAIIASSTSREA